MRVFLMANNRLGLQVTSFLKNRKDTEIVGAAIPAPDRRLHSEAILKALALPESKIFDASKVNTPETIAELIALEADIAVNVLCPYIIKKALLAIFPKGFINLHHSYLPLNGGIYPNVWSIVTGTTAGVTVHYIDEGIDTGDIILQKKVEMTQIDTGETLYRKLEELSLPLFMEAWELIVADRVVPIKQNPAAGSYYSQKDVERLDCIDLDRQYTARDLINILRARTFAGYKGAYFLDNGKRVFMELKLTAE